MFEIVEKQTLGPNVTRYEIKAPRVAKSHHIKHLTLCRCPYMFNRFYDVALV
jgi:hypothetical protein